MEVRGRRQRRNHDESPERLVSVRGSHGEVSHQSGSHRSRDKSWDFVDRDSGSSKRRRPQNAVMDAMSRVLHRAARSPFSNEIE